MNRWDSRKRSNKKPFSLEDEAKTTHFRLANADLKLRANRIAFVSAGTSSGEDLTRSVQTTTHSPIEESTNIAAASESDVPLDGMADLKLAGPITPMTVDYSSSLDTNLSQNRGTQLMVANDRFFIDSQGSMDSVNTSLAPPVVRRPLSPASSVSSDEVIVFGGRDRSRFNLENYTTPVLQSKNPVSICDPVTIIQSSASSSRGRRVTCRADSPLPHGVGEARIGSGDDGQPVSMNNKSCNKSKRHTGKSGQKRARSAFARDAVLADYIENIDGDDDMGGLARGSVLRGRQLDQIDTDGWQDELEDSEIKPGAESNTSYSVSWEPADLEAFDDLSTSGEVLAEVRQVVSQRERPSGRQYLVVFEGYSVDDARWLPVALLDGPTTHEKLRIYETDQAQREQYLVTTNSDLETDEDKQLARDVQVEIDDQADEQDLLDKYKDEMTDEQIARLLSKQEELGLGSHDLLLYDGAQQYSLSGNAVPRPYTNTSSDKLTRSQKKDRKRTQNEYASASVMADVLEQDPYDGFDIMDQDRPSLRRKAKGRRGKLPLELSDSEIEPALQSQWERDRKKKKARKEERENLRSQGLLSRNGNVDLRAKYPAGMPLAEVKDEIIVFLGSTDPNLVLPPMPDRDRKLVHEIANVFNAKSKSSGKGNSRFPIIYRTNRTRPFDESLLSKKLSRWFLGRTIPRVVKPNKTSTAALGVARGGGFSKAAVSYRDGEVVGASAPELAQDNKGRAMLERMGWSTGTALGATHNKGIMQPVAHVVKNSKAGLG